MEVSIEGMRIRISSANDRHLERRRLLGGIADPNPYTDRERRVDDDLMANYCLIQDAIQALVVEGLNTFGIDVIQNDGNPNHDAQRSRIRRVLETYRNWLRRFINENGLDNEFENTIDWNDTMARSAEYNDNRTVLNLLRLDNAITRDIVRRRPREW
jgi:hypothetical protein